MYLLLYRDWETQRDIVTGKLMGHDDVEINVDESRVRPWEIWHLQSDNSKLYSVIDFRPNTSLEIALQKTIEYFYQNGKTWNWVK